MDEQQKKEIALRLAQYVKRAGSQAKAANKMGIAGATVNAILKGNYDLISSEMWRKVESHMSDTKEGEWVHVQTNVYNEVTQVLVDAQLNTSCTWVIAEAGAGKTTAARLYEQSHPGVYYVLCSEDMKKGDFLREVLRVLGKKNTSKTMREMMNEIIEEVRVMKNPLFIFDEGDKVLDSILLYFVTLYNHLEDKAGMVFLSTDHMEKRMEAGLRYRRRGYNEFHSRIGRRFYRVPGATPGEVAAICRENGITDEKTITEIIKDADAYDYDLRRVKKIVKARQKMTI